MTIFFNLHKTEKEMLSSKVFRDTFACWCLSLSVMKIIPEVANQVKKKKSRRMEERDRERERSSTSLMSVSRERKSKINLDTSETFFFLEFRDFLCLWNESF